MFSIDDSKNKINSSLEEQINKQTNKQTDWLLWRDYINKNGSLERTEYYEYILAKTNVLSLPSVHYMTVTKTSSCVCVGGWGGVGGGACMRV